MGSALNKNPNLLARTVLLQNIQMQPESVDKREPRIAVPWKKQHQKKALLSRDCR